MSLAYGIIALISLCMVGVCVVSDKKRDVWLLLVFVSVSVCNLGYFMLSVSQSLGAALNSNRLALIAKFKDNASGDVLLGDVNLDGAVNAVDSNLLKRSIAGEYYIVSASDNAKAADINGDGQINAVDSNLLKRMIAGEYQP